MVTRRLWLMMALVAVMLAVLTWFYPSNSDFRGENPYWNGARDFLDDFHPFPLNSLDALPARSRRTSLILIPYLDFSSADLEKLEDYVNSGGKLLVLDDYGFGNEILEHLGLEARFTGSQLLDPLFDYKNKNLPKIIDFGADPSTSEVKSLVFNHATSLDNVPRDQVIAWSSYFSFSDENQNGDWDEEEPKGPLPVIANLEIGKGELVLIADPSILISSMIHIDDNQQFLKKVVQGEVYLDQSHLPDVPLDEAKVLLKVSRNTVATIWGSLGLVLLVLTLTLKPIWHNQGGQNG